MCANGIGLAVVGQANQIARSVGAPTELAITFAGAVSICNGVGRILFGSLYDQFRRRPTMVAITASFVVALVLMIAALKSASLSPLIAAFVLIGAAYGGTPTTNATFVNRMYGRQNYASNLGAINTTIIFASILGPTIASSVVDETGSYLGCFVIFLVVSFASMGLPFFIRKS